MVVVGSIARSRSRGFVIHDERGGFDHQAVVGGRHVTMCLLCPVVEVKGNGRFTAVLAAVVEGNVKEVHSGSSCDGRAGVSGHGVRFPSFALRIEYTHDNKRPATPCQYLGQPQGTKIKRLPGIDTEIPGRDDVRTFTRTGSHMTPGKANRIARNVHRKPRPRNGTQFRNRINQAAHKYATSERRIHAALTTATRKVQVG